MGRIQLSNDILRLLADIIYEEHDVITLRSLTLGCQAYYEVFLPYLYRRIKIHGLHQMLHLMHVLYRRPELIHYVKHLEVEYIWEWDQEVYPIKIQYDATLLNTWSARMSINMDDQKRWEERARAGYSDAWTAFLIVQLGGGLRTLRMTYPSDYEFYRSPSETDLETFKMVQEMLVRAALQLRPFDQGPPFPHLQHIFLSNTDPTAAIPFLHFPSVRKISGERIWNRPSLRIFPDYFCGRIDYPPKASPVIDIDLKNSFDYQGFRDWINSCQELASFQIADYLEDKEWEYKFNPSVFPKAFLSAKRTLQHLTVHLAGEDWAENGLERVYSIGSLADLSALKVLHLNYRVAIEHTVMYRFEGQGEWLARHARPLEDLLPVSLEKLILCRFIPERPERPGNLPISKLSSLVTRREQRLPKLKQVTMYTVPVHDCHEGEENKIADLRKERDEVLASLSSLFAESGIIFQCMDKRC